jgi:Cysteine sulfinate desulfinase/cysteine desulfurase and related enzymes
VAALYVKKGAPYCPLILGGHQENGRRAGTENSLGIIGLGKAMELRALEMDAEEKRLLELKNILERTASQKPSRTCSSWATPSTACRAP